MNSLSLFFQKTVRSLVLTPNRLEAISEIDPSHIYVENVRAVFGISTRVATWLCELAVRQGFFEKRVEVHCPDRTVAAEASSREKLPERVPCWEEKNGLLEERWYETSRLRNRCVLRLHRRGGRLMISNKQADVVDRLTHLGMKVAILLFTMLGFAAVTIVFFYCLLHHQGAVADGVSGFGSTFFGGWFGSILYSLFFKPTKSPTDSSSTNLSRNSNPQIGP